MRKIIIDNDLAVGTIDWTMPSWLEKLFEDSDADTRVGMEEVIKTNIGMHFATMTAKLLAGEDAFTSFHLEVQERTKSAVRATFGEKKR